MIGPARGREGAARSAGGWRTARGTLPLDRPLVMGILNVTPDSFSDGGELEGVDGALRRAESMAAEGAGILDVGGESTRPGAAAVPEEEEVRRALPVVEALVRELDLPVSIDTRKAEVARRALDAGAAVVNDVSGFAFDPESAGVAARAGAGVVVMHMRGTPADMRERTEYAELSAEVAAELDQATQRARAAGLPDEAIVVDPGLGFAKTGPDSVRLLAELEHVLALGFPVLVGPSRKSFLGELLGVGPRERILGGAVACALAYERGARIFRVHDVRETVQALAVARAIAGSPRTGRGGGEAPSGKRAGAGGARAGGGAPADGEESQA